MASWVILWNFRAICSHWKITYNIQEMLYIHLHGICNWLDYTTWHLLEKFNIMYLISEVATQDHYDKPMNADFGTTIHNLRWQQQSSKVLLKIHSFFKAMRTLANIVIIEFFKAVEISQKFAVIPGVFILLKKKKKGWILVRIVSNMAF